MSGKDNAQYSDKIKNIVEKLKKDKKSLLILILGISGMLLILFSGSSEKEDENNIDKNDIIYDSSYTYNITDDIEELIKSINGAGKTKVLITYESSEETVYATDTEEKSNNENNQIKKEHIITENDKAESGLTVKILYPKVRGVAVICEGGDDPIVKERVYSLLSALFDISYNDISVASMV